MDKGELIREGQPKEVCEMYLEAFYEEQQGISKVNKFKQVIQLPDYSKAKDQRQAFINASNLRNDLKIFKFNSESASFGKAGAQIRDVSLLDESANPLSWIVGGEKVSLQILAEVFIDLDSPIVGFWVNDRLGQILFGDNSCITYNDKSVNYVSGDILEASFIFNMPILPVGEYSITVAVANGDQNDHVQHHWVHDAIMFKSESSSVALGLLGIPMIDIKLGGQISNK